MSEPERQERQAGMAGHGFVRGARRSVRSMTGSTSSWKRRSATIRTIPGRYRHASVTRWGDWSHGTSRVNSCVPARTDSVARRSPVVATEVGRRLRSDATRPGSGGFCPPAECGGRVMGTRRVPGTQRRGAPWRHRRRAVSHRRSSGAPGGDLGLVCHDRDMVELLAGHGLAMLGAHRLGFGHDRVARWAPS